LRLGKVTRGNGFAYLDVTVNGAGIIKVTGPKISMSFDIPMSNGTSRIMVKARPNARKQLRRTGKLKVRAEVRFRAIAGGKLLTQAKTLTLIRKKQPRNHRQARPRH
jgi:hypothetical protein